MTLRKVHSDFRLNGNFYSEDDLVEVAYSLIKEGVGFEQGIGNFLQRWLDDSESLAVMTSGTTGSPKTISLQKRYMANSALATGSFFGLKPKDTALLCLPSEYIAGKMMLVRAMVLGLHLDYVAPSSRPLLASKKNYDFSAMVPLQVANSIPGIDRIKTLLIGGAPISLALIKQLHGLNSQIYETYGMTETISHIAARRIDMSDVTKGEQLPFKTLPNITLSKDTRDCLVINAQGIADAPVVTNDMVNLISEKEFEWLGRVDLIINSGGIKLNPEQIEAKLAGLIDNRFFVAGIPDDRLGQKLVLIVEGEGSLAIIKNKLASIDSLKTYERPKEILMVPIFEETGSGKVLRADTLASL